MGLKSLNFWGVGESRFFTVTFTDDGPHPPARHPLRGYPARRRQEKGDLPGGVERSGIILWTFRVDANPPWEELLAAVCAESRHRR
jgi:hypothetical protein